MSELDEIKMKLAEAKRRKSQADEDEARQRREDIYSGIVRRKIDEYHDEKRERSAAFAKAVFIRALSVAGIMLMLSGGGLLSLHTFNQLNRLSPSKCPCQVMAGKSNDSIELDHCLQRIFSESGSPQAIAGACPKPLEGEEGPEEMLEFLKGKDFSVISSYANERDESYFAHCRFNGAWNCSVGLKREAGRLVLVSLTWL